MRTSLVFITALILADSNSVIAQETHGSPNSPKTQDPEETVVVPPQLSGQPSNNAPFDLPIESYQFGGEKRLINKTVFEKIIEDIKNFQKIDSEDYKAREAFLEKIPSFYRDFVRRWNLDDAVRFQKRNLRLRFNVEQVSPTELKMTFPESQIFNPHNREWGFKSSFLSGSEGKASYWVDFKFNKKVGDTYVFLGSENNEGWKERGVMSPKNCTLILDAKGKILSVDLKSQKMETSAKIKAKAQ
jgi:hypothetical protein